MIILLLTLVSAVSSQDCKFSSYISPKEGSYVVRSPQHPAKYPPSSNCYWYYYTDPGNRLSLDCYSVDMGNYNALDCKDTLSVIGTTNDRQSYCTTFTAQSTSNKILINLKSQPNSVGGRFLCVIRPMREEECDCGWTPKTRVVGGVETGINEFPMMTSIIDARKRRHACGGSIISQNYVITAAHCLDVLDVRSTGLLVGEHDMSTGTETNSTKLHRAAQFIIHPDYDRKTSWNDIGLIRSATPIQFSNRVGPVCLPFNRPYLPKVDNFVTAIGWGTISFGGPTSDVLLKTRIQVVPESRCTKVFNNSAASGKQVCTYTSGKDTCQMDSGGPLISPDPSIARYFLAGLVSFGPNDCGGSDPSVSTRVTSYLDWIQKQTGEKFCIKL